MEVQIPALKKKGLKPRKIYKLLSDIKQTRKKKIKKKQKIVWHD